MTLLLAVLLQAGGGAAAQTPAPPTHPRGTLVARIQFESRTYAVAVSPWNVVYVTQPDLASLARVGLRTRRALKSIPVGKMPTGLTFSGGGARAYVANQFSQSISVVYFPGDSQAREIPVPGDPFFTALARDNRRLLVTTNVDSVFVIDLDSLTVRGVVGLPGAGATITFDPPGTRAYVSVPDAGVVSEIDVASLHELRRFATGRRPQGLAVSPDGTELYIADEREHEVKIWDLGSGTLRSSVALEGPAWDLQLTPDSTQIYVGLLDGAVQILDRADRSVVRTVRLGGRPRRIGFDRSGTTAVVANEAGWVDILR